MRILKLSILLLASAALLACGPKVSEDSILQAEFGWVAAGEGLWKEALYRWRKAVELDPDNAGYRNNLAVAYEGLGELEKAGRAYEKALELDPDNKHIRENYERFVHIYRKQAESGDSA